MTPQVKEIPQRSNSVRIGVISRIDYGSSGFRKGLLDIAAEIFKNMSDGLFLHGTRVLQLNKVPKLFLNYEACQQVLLS